MAAMQPGIYSLQQGMCEVGPTDVPKQLGASDADPIGDWRQQLDPTFEPAHDLTAQKQSIPARFELGPPFEDDLRAIAGGRLEGCVLERAKTDASAAARSEEHTSELQSLMR